MEHFDRYGLIEFKEINESSQTFKLIICKKTI
ncbi:MAG: hypothetical protein ACI9DO_001436 [Reinekea sp.]|jgi:hypothetical protein